MDGWCTDVNKLFCDYIKFILFPKIFTFWIIAFVLSLNHNRTGMTLVRTN